jgi:hypothetical protein
VLTILITPVVYNALRLAAKHRIEPAEGRCEAAPLCWCLI